MYKDWSEEIMSRTVFWQITPLKKTKKVLNLLIWLHLHEANEGISQKALTQTQIYVRIKVEGGCAPGEWKAGGEGVLHTTVSASRLL